MKTILVLSVVAALAASTAALAAEPTPAHPEAHAQAEAQTTMPARQALLLEANAMRNLAMKVPEKADYYNRMAAQFDATARKVPAGKTVQLPDSQVKMLLAYPKVAAQPLSHDMETQARIPLPGFQSDNNASSAGQDAPIHGPDGVLEYVYGQSHPVIICAPLQVCDLRLQIGEHINNLNVGDTSRWSIAPSISGIGDTATEHLIIKPLAVGLSTTMVIATNMRTYHIALVSSASTYMPYVGFIYPQSTAELMAAFQAKQAAAETTKARETLPNGQYLGNLNFNYELSGDAPFKPLRVYDDGVKTIIQLPADIKHGEAPVLLLLTDGNGKGIAPTLVNYRLVGSDYIVDTVIHKAELVAGVGGGRQRVTITRTSGQ
jgi:type IV secretion system protein VirB9